MAVPSVTPSDAGAGASGSGSLTPKQVEQVSALVYRLMRNELLRQHERRGGAAPAWR